MRDESGTQHRPRPLQAYLSVTPYAYMKRLAVIGVLSKTTAETYWNTISNESDQSRGPGPLAPVLVHGFHSRTYAAQFQTGDWPALESSLLEEARGAQLLGAEALVIGSSVLNPAAPLLRRTLNLPVIDLPFALQEKLHSLGFTRVGVLGLRTVREERMLRAGLRGIDLLTPTPADQRWLGDALSQTLTGEAVPPAWVIRSFRLRSEFLKQRAQAVLLADPVLTRWLTAEDSLLLPPIDLATTHAWAAALWALEADHLPAPPCVAV